MTNGIILNQYKESDKSIKMHTSTDDEIENYQTFILLESEIIRANAIEKQFDGKFQGNPSPLYNCHGLTFASKRTGIYSDTEIWKILKCEYQAVASVNDLLVGDIILYLERDNETSIIHSGIVVTANHSIGTISEVRIYSKVLKAREITHSIYNCPYHTGNNVKFYRINHANRYRILS